MRELTAREVLSLCLVILLRLVRVPCPDHLLKRWFEVDIDYVDSLISLATRHTGPLDSFVLDTALDPDRWTLSFEVLGTSHDVLYSSWTTVYSSLLHSKRVPCGVVAALFVSSNRFAHMARADAASSKSSTERRLAS